jgi:hypothetical protein
VNQYGCDSSAKYTLTVNPNPSCVIIGGNPGNAPYCVGGGLPAPLGVYTAPAGMSAYKWTAQGAIEIIGDDDASSVSVEVNGVGTLYLEVTNEFGCKSTCQKMILVQAGAPCSLDGPEKVCAETENIYTDASASEEGTVFQWSLLDGDGNPVSADVAYFIGATDGASVTVKSGVNGGSYIVRLFKEEPGACPSTCEIETVIIPKVVLTAQGTDPKCFEGTGKLEFSATGGTGTITYMVNTVSASSPYTAAAGIYNIEASDENGCKADTTITLTEPSKLVLTANGPASLCETETGLVTFSAVGGTGAISYTVNGLTASSPYTATSGSYTIVATDANMCTDTKLVTINTKICVTPYCTYTQGYFGNLGGKACTPDGQKTTTQLITGSLANMPGGILYLGIVGRSFTATNATDIIRIMPGGGSPDRLPNGNHTPSSDAILKKGRIDNVLLSQTIALALNTYMQESPLRSLSLAEGGGSTDKYFVTVAKKGGDCSSLSTAVPAECKFSPVYCSDGVTISGYTTTYNPYRSWKISSKVINALPADKTVLDLLNFASAVLGGATLPSGVSYSDVSGAVAAINEGFDECRLFVGFSATSSVSVYCTPPDASACPAPIISARTRNNNIVASVDVMELTINAYPNPFIEQLNFRFVSPVSGKAILEVYNVHGQRLGVVFDGNVSAGAQNFASFKNHSSATGMLIYKLNVGGKVLTGKVQSLK